MPFSSQSRQTQVTFLSLLKTSSESCRTYDSVTLNVETDRQQSFSSSSFIDLENDISSADFSFQMLRINLLRFRSMLEKTQWRSSQIKGDTNFLFYFIIEAFCWRRMSRLFVVFYEMILQRLSFILLQNSAQFLDASTHLSLKISSRSGPSSLVQFALAALMSWCISIIVIMAKMMLSSDSSKSKMDALSSRMSSITHRMRTEMLYFDVIISAKGFLSLAARKKYSSSSGTFTKLDTGGCLIKSARTCCSPSGAYAKEQGFSSSIFINITQIAIIYYH